MIRSCRKMNRLLIIWMSILMSISGTNTYYSDKASIGTYNYYVDQLEQVDISTQTTYAYQLEGRPTRLEGALLMYRLLGEEASKKTYKHVFNDVPKEASNAIGYLYQNRYIAGMSHNTFGSSRPITASGFATLLLRVLGYSDVRGDFDYTQATKLLKDKQIISNTLYQAVNQGVFKRRHMVEMTYNTLKAPVKNTDKTLAECLLIKGSINLESAQQIGVIPSNYKSLPSILTEYRTNYNTKDYIELTGKEDKLYLSGKTEKYNKKWLWWKVIGTDIEYDQNQYIKEGKIGMNLSGIGDGGYTIDIYTNSEQYGSYASWMYGIPVIKRNGQLLFPLAPVYTNNYEKYHFAKGVLNEDALLQPSEYVQSKDAKIVQLAHKITKNAKTDYEKVKAIHDWVAGNIYYDKDAFNKGQYGALDATSVLDEKKSVCQGYATLTAALMRAVSIPCAVVAGYALGITTDGDWSDNMEQEANHAWNECYVDGRWVIIDTTWDSRNEYINGKYVSGDMSSEYFDTTLEHFSRKHKIMEYCWYY